MKPEVLGRKHSNGNHGGASTPWTLTVWCALLQGRIIGPYFLENEEEKAETGNGERYHTMLTDFFIPWVEQYVAIDVSHHEGEQVTSARLFSEKSDFCVWGCQMASSISRSFTPWL